MAGISIKTGVLILTLATVLLVGTTFTYWMSPLGLGIFANPQEKLGHPLASGLYYFIYFLGPALLLLGPIIILLLGAFKRFGPRAIAMTSWIILLTVLLQVAVLTFLSI